MLYDKAYKIRGEDGEERKTPNGGDLYAMAHVGKKMKGPSDLPRSFWMRASDQTLDRDGDIIRAAGWDLENYHKNPVGLWMHDYRELPVFRGAETRLTETELWVLMDFPEELGGLSNDVFKAFEANVLRASSVGFGPKVTEEDEEIRAEYGLPPVNPNSWNDGILFWEQELWELSAVTVPSNPEALASLKSMQGVDTLKEMLQRSEDFVIELTYNDTSEHDCDECGDTGETELATKFDDGTYTRDLLIIPCPECDKGKEKEREAEEATIAHMIKYLEDAGYIVTDDMEPIEIELDLSNETLTTTVELDLTPEPAGELLDADTLDKLARYIADAQTPEEVRKIRERAARAAKRAVDYHLGKVVEDK